MNLEISPITSDQWRKVTRALAYSFGSGFVGGFTLAITGALTTHSDIGSATLTAFAVAGVVGGLNAIAVTVKQLFTPDV